MEKEAVSDGLPALTSGWGLTSPHCRRPATQSRPISLLQRPLPPAWASLHAPSPPPWAIPHVGGSARSTDSSTSRNERNCVRARFPPPGVCAFGCGPGRVQRSHGNTRASCMYSDGSRLSHALYDRRDPNQHAADGALDQAGRRRRHGDDGAAPAGRGGLGLCAGRPAAAAAAPGLEQQQPSRRYVLSIALALLARSLAVRAVGAGRSLAWQDDAWGER